MDTFDKDVNVLRRNKIKKLLYLLQIVWELISYTSVSRFSKEIYVTSVCKSHKHWVKKEFYLVHTFLWRIKTDCDKKPTIVCTCIDSPSEEMIAVILLYSMSWNLTDLVLSKMERRWFCIVCESEAWPRISSSAGSDTKKNRGNIILFFSRYLLTTGGFEHFETMEETERS